MRFSAVVIGAVVAAVSMSSASAAVRIVADGGGQIGPYLESFAALRGSGQKVVIDGPCLSACTLVLGVIPRERICVTRRARLGFHAAWHPGENGRPTPSRGGTQLLMDRMRQGPGPATRPGAVASAAGRQMKDEFPVLLTRSIFVKGRQIVSPNSGGPTTSSTPK